MTTETWAPMTKVRPAKILKDKAVDQIMGIAFTGSIGYQFTLKPDTGWHLYYYPNSDEGEEDQLAIWVNVLDYRIFRFERGARILEFYSGLREIEKLINDLNIRYYGSEQPAVPTHLHPTVNAIPLLIDETRRWQLMTASLRVIDHSDLTQSEEYF